MTTTPVTLTYEQVAADLRELAAERPDYVYKQPLSDSMDITSGVCMYFAPDGAPSCMVGHALARHGITRDDLGGANEDTSIRVVNAGGDVLVLQDQRALYLLEAVQAAQDLGVPWGRAVEDALRLDDPA